MPPDYHLHTPLCKHAEGSTAEFRRFALERGVEEICFTDHSPAPDGYDPSHRMVIEEFQEYRAMVLTISENNAPRVLFGIEADYYEGCRMFLDEWLPRQSFDLVLGSVHYIDGWGFDNPKERSTWDGVDVAGVWRTYFRMVGKLAESRLFDAVAHLDLPKKFGYRPPDRCLKEMAQPALDAIAGAGMAIEINTSGLRKPVKEIYPSPLLLALAREREIPICFGSDAHLPEEVGYGFSEALLLAAEAGYTRAARFRERESIFYSLT